MSNNISARHDPFLHFVNRFAHRAYENRRILSFLFVALIVCGLSFLGWTYYGKGQEKKASDLYFLGQQVYEKVEAKKLEDLQSGRKKEEKKRVDSSVAPSGQPLNDGEKGIGAYKEVILHWEKTAKEYPSTISGSLAMLQLGSLYYRHQDYEKALTYFKKAEAAVSDDLLKILVCYNMGNTLEALHQYEAALKYYEKLLSYDMEFVSQEAHLGLARCYEAMQQLDKAKATYENFAKKYPNSPLLKSEIDNQLFLLEQFGQEYKKYFSKDKK